CAARRVAVWRLSPDRTPLICEDCFDRSANDHTTGMEMHRDQLPDMFAALGNGAPIDTVDAAPDRRTAERVQTYPAQLAINNVYIVPILANGRLMGMLSVEDPRRGDHAAGLVPFCDALSVVLALRYAAAAPPVPVAARAAAIAAAGSGGAIESF